MPKTCLLEATSVKNYCIVKMLDSTKSYILQRCEVFEKEWYTWSDDGFKKEFGTIPKLVSGIFTDDSIGNGIYQYRAKEDGASDDEWEYSLCIRSSNNGKPIGYTFGNYKTAEGDWGEVLTPDDIHYTYLWGVGFRASDGTPFTDEQTKFFINASLKEIGRRLNITIKKTRVACEPQRRQLEKDKDYDEEESFYTFNWARVQRQGFIATRKRPVSKVTKLDLISRTEKIRSYLDCYTLDKTKGLIKFFNPPYRMNDTGRGIRSAVSPFRDGYFGGHLFYSIDYIAGYESADDVPDDLREIIAKHCAVALLNIIGDGLISGFSSSSLSMDGLSESFSSTQSATSAYFGARIKVYEDEIEKYVKENKNKFGHLVMGAV